MNDILVYSGEGYKIYMCSIDEIDTYYLVIPNKDSAKFSLCIDIPDGDLRYLDNKVIIDNILENLVSLHQDNVIYLLPVLPKELIVGEMEINDDALYRKLEDILISLANDTFNRIIENNKAVEQTIYLGIIDEKQKYFLDWLSLNSQYANYIRGITLTRKDNYQGEVQEEYYTMDDNTGNSGNSLSGNGGVTVEKSSSKKKVKVLPSKHGYTSFSLIGLIITIVSVMYILIK